MPISLCLFSPAISHSHLSDVLRRTYRRRSLQRIDSSSLDPMQAYGDVSNTLAPHLFQVQKPNSSVTSLTAARYARQIFHRFPVLFPGLVHAVVTRSLPSDLPQAPETPGTDAGLLVGAPFLLNWHVFTQSLSLSLLLFFFLFLLSAAPLSEEDVAIAVVSEADEVEEVILSPQTAGGGTAAVLPLNTESNSPEPTTTVLARKMSVTPFGPDYVNPLMELLRQRKAPTVATAGDSEEAVSSSPEAESTQQPSVEPKQEQPLA